MADFAEAKVKSVLSGDTIILQNTDDLKQQRILSLAYVSAPRLKRDGDEPFAFESRDFLRRLLVGKVVCFSVLYTTLTNPRDYGAIHLSDGSSRMLPDGAVAEGWLKLRHDGRWKENSEESMTMVNELKELEGKAKAASKGLWNETVSSIRCQYELPDPAHFVDLNKGTSVDAIVEKVLGGDRFILRFMPSSTEHIQTQVIIAGIRTPSVKRANQAAEQEQPIESLEEESQNFAESRLLQRSVTANILGVSPQGHLICSVMHRDHGSIAPFLLRAGLARCIDYHSTMLGHEMASLRQAEKHAKDRRLGLFKDLAKPKNSSDGIEAVVVRIHTADTLYVRNKMGAEKRVSLSSVRQPKPQDPKQSPWCAEAKEFVRKYLISKQVKVSIDGIRPANEGYDAREMVTITKGDKNFGLLLVENGLASVIRHRPDDSDRSPVYDDLRLAEDDAQKEGRGMWTSKAASNKEYVDYSGSVQLAKRHMAFLSRQKRVAAVVDYVKSGSRFALLLPQENAKLTLVLSGIRVPKSARNPKEQSEPFGQEACEFANKRCLQRDVEVDIKEMDKVGGFIGSLYIKRENFAELLLKEGLASVHTYLAEKWGQANEFLAAERKAKENRVGMWHSWDPTKPGVDGDQQIQGRENGSEGRGKPNVQKSRTKDYRSITVTHVDESGRLKIQEVNSGTNSLTSLMAKFQAFHLKPNQEQLVTLPKAGDYVAARFSADNEWYRARIRRNDREAKKAEIVYIDYGNTETVPYTRLRPLTQTEFSTSSLKPQAQDAVLSFVQLPSPENYLAESVEFLRQIVNEQLVVNMDCAADAGGEGVLHVTLFNPQSSNSSEQSLNVDLVSAGLAVTKRRLMDWEKAETDVLKAVKDAEESAKNERKGMWEYGDLTGDD